MKTVTVRQFRFIIYVLFTASLTTAAHSQVKSFELWPDGVPGKIKSPAEETYTDHRIRHVNIPNFTVFLPSPGTATGTAVVICPGGGYGLLAIEKEGYDVAKWFNSIGVAAFVLKYRLGDWGHPAPLQDAQRAMRMVRGAAADYGIDPSRIGIMGFSAGGHLASTAGTHYNSKVYDPSDAADRKSARPDFMILMYPVVSMKDGVTHQGSKRNLLGESPPNALVESMTNELSVNAKTPPTFLIHATDDTAVPVENSLGFYNALRKSGVPAEIHIYEKGGHGFGLGKGRGAVESWPGLCEDWMRGMGLLEKGA